MNLGFLIYTTFFVPTYLQVFLNIVGNAIKFTADGEVTVDIEIIPRPQIWQGQQHSVYLKVNVMDTNIGVALDQQSKLFKKFVHIFSA